MNSEQDAYQDALRELVECNLHKSTQELANTLPQKIPIHNLPPLKKNWKVNKLGVWVPHTLCKKNKNIAYP